MNKKNTLIMITVILLLFSSCFGQRNRRTAIIPIPDTEFFDFILPIKMEDIIETKSGTGTRAMPDWFRAYINGGIKAVEEMEIYGDKYMFVARSEGNNFRAMTRWADFFSPTRDTTMLVARRIDNKLITSAALYPDNEYGAFYHSLILNAYSTGYPDAVKEDTYWIKMRVIDEEEEEYTEIYVFFVLISIEKTTLQSAINNMISKSMPSVSIPVNQRNAIERIRHNFFEGF